MKRFSALENNKNGSADRQTDARQQDDAAASQFIYCFSAFFRSAFGAGSGAETILGTAF